VSLSPTPDFHVVKAGSFATAATQKILPCSPSTGTQPAVGAFTSVAALPGRRLIEVSNDDATNSFRVGDNTVAANVGGVTVYPKTMRQFWVTAEVALYIIADAATPLAQWLEYA